MNHSTQKALSLGLVILASCAPAQSRTSALTLKLPVTMLALGSKDLSALKYQETTITPNSPECGSSAFEMPGQGWDIGLTGGGISLWGQHYGAAVRQPTAEALYGLSPAQLDYAQPYELRLFILDHFTPVRLLLRETAQAAPTEVSVVHGALVEAHIRAILESAGFEYAGTNQRGTLTYRAGQRIIRLERVSLDETSRVSAKGPAAAAAPSTGEQIRDTLQGNLAFKSFLLGSKAINAVPVGSILNMSFSMLPCAIMNHYRAQRDTRAAASVPQRYTLNEYLSDLAAYNQVPVADLKRDLTNVSPQEPLMKYLGELLSQRQYIKVLAVASSGNYGLDFSTAPGAAPQVISVGGTTWEGGPLVNSDGLRWSDTADIETVGEWYTLSTEQLTRFCRYGGTCVASDLMSNPERYAQFAYRGTSFAAPTVSAYLALTISNKNTCFDTSALGFANLRKSASVKFKELIEGCGESR